LWPDWLDSKAWRAEHNTQHHTGLNEVGRDPDVVSVVFENVRAGAGDMGVAVPMGGGVASAVWFALLAAVWKWVYFATNIIGRSRVRDGSRTTFLFCVGDEDLSWHDLIFRAFGPGVLTKFICVPLAHELIQPGCWKTALCTMLAAEVLHNFQSFAVIVPNHSGADLPLFSTPCPPASAEAYRRAVVASANFVSYGPVSDALVFGYLNYQIEHHVDDTLTPLEMVRLAPLLRVVAAKHNVSYCCEPVWKRVARLYNLFTGAEVQVVAPPN